MNSAASFDPYFTSCLAASILWQSSAPSILPVMTSVKKSMMSAPSPVFSRTMSAIVGGLRSVVVSVVVSDRCSSMREGWGFVKRENCTAEGGEGAEGGVLGLSESGFWGLGDWQDLGGRGWVPVCTGTTVWLPSRLLTFDPRIEYGAGFSPV